MKTEPTPAQRAAIELLRTADQVRRSLADAIEPHGVTFQQYNVLRILRGAAPEPLPTLDIRERLIERMPGITRLLDQLEKRGLVRRERSLDDRRVVHAWITEGGLALLASMDEDVDQADEAALARLDAEEHEALLRLLRKVNGPG